MYNLHITYNYKLQPTTLRTRFNRLYAEYSASALIYHITHLSINHFVILYVIQCMYLFTVNGTTYICVVYHIK